MGNSISVSLKRFSIYRFLSQSICYSYYINPRNLELYTYAYWTAEFTALLLQIHPQLQDQTLIISPQFPISIPSLEPDSPDTSYGSQPDSQARGVCVDLALVMPVFHPRSLSKTPKKLHGKTLSHFFSKYLHGLLPDSQPISPRHLCVLGLITPILAEIKREPLRRPENINKFIQSLVGLSDSAKRQAVLQAQVLFMSWQYRFEGNQKFVILLAGIGPYYSLGVYRRSQAVTMWRTFTRGKQASTAGLEGFKKIIGNLIHIKSSEADDDDDDDDDDDEHWDTAARIGDPDVTHAQQKKADEKLERDARAARRSHWKTVMEEVAKEAPNYTAYDQPVFSEEQLEAVQPGLFQTTNLHPAFFVNPANVVSLEDEAQWTGLYILGSKMSDNILKVVVEVVRKEFHEPELDRRKQISFPSKNS